MNHRYDNSFEVASSGEEQTGRVHFDLKKRFLFDLVNRIHNEVEEEGRDREPWHSACICHHNDDKVLRFESFPC